MRWYTVRWTALRPVRLAVRGLAWLVSRIPGTTNGEVAEMGLTPCERCMGHAVANDVRATGGYPFDPETGLPWLIR